MKTSFKMLQKQHTALGEGSKKKKRGGFPFLSPWALPSCLETLRRERGDPGTPAFPECGFQPSQEDQRERAAATLTPGGTAPLHTDRSEQLESCQKTKTNPGRGGHTLLCALPTGDSFPLQGSTRGQSTWKDKPGPWWWLQSSFYLLKSLLSRVMFF